MEETTSTQFAARFSGRTDARGGVGGLCVHEIVSQRHYTAHLMGRESLGVYPLRDDGTCLWIAVDFDRTGRGITQEQADHAALTDASAVADSLYALGLNGGAYPELSKSKGAHLWVFFDAPVLAYDARRIMTAACIAARVTKYELFPKQDEVARGGVGNYINLPYFGASPRRRMLEWQTWEPIALSTFLQACVPFPASLVPLVLESIPPSPRSTRSTIPNGHYRTATPCYEAMLQHPAGEGERNDMAAALAMHSNRIGLPKEVTLSVVDNWNDGCLPPLDSREVARTVESVYAKGYKSLWCEHRVVRPFCSATCPVFKAAQTGRKEDDDAERQQQQATRDQGDLRVESLQIQTSSPPLYHVTVNGKEITLSGPVLASWNKFKLAVMEQTRFLPSLPRGQKWEAIVQELLETAEEIEAPPEASIVGVVGHRIDRFLMEMARTETIEDVYDGMLYVADDCALFRFEKLIDYLARYGVGERITHPELWGLLRRRGGMSVVQRIGERTLRLWKVPLPITREKKNEDIVEDNKNYNAGRNGVTEQNSGSHSEGKTA